MKDGLLKIFDSILSSPFLLKLIQKTRLAKLWLPKNSLTKEYEYMCFKSQFLGKNFTQYRERNLPTKKIKQVKHIAFYLSQFHSIPENDKWWEKNFTEWNNVVKTIPQFEGHYQPHLPYDLGFYNLLDKKTWEEQIRMAKNYGIYGFCFYFYWFSGKRLLEKPLDLFLSKKDLDMPFCLFWANDSWVRTWHGFSDYEQGNRILLKQQHSHEDDRNVFNYLLNNIFSDERYIKVNGKPLFIIYHTHLFPNIEATIKIWRDMAKEKFKDIYLMHVLMPEQEDSNPEEIGFDAQLQFSPLGCSYKSLNKTKFSPYSGTEIYDYRHLVKTENKRIFKYPNVVRACFPSWDNEGRRPTKGTCFVNNSVKEFKKYLSKMNAYALNNKIEGEAFVFLNAWNEWAEGAHLEPDREYGYSWLDALADVIENNGGYKK